MHSNTTSIQDATWEAMKQKLDMSRPLGMPLHLWESYFKEIGLTVFRNYAEYGFSGGYDLPDVLVSNPTGFFETHRLNFLSWFNEKPIGNSSTMHEIATLVNDFEQSEVVNIDDIADIMYANNTKHTYYEQVATRLCSYLTTQMLTAYYEAADIVDENGKFTVLRAMVKDINELQALGMKVALSEALINQIGREDFIAYYHDDTTDIFDRINTDGGNDDFIMQNMDSILDFVDKVRGGFGFQATRLSFIASLTRADLESEAVSVDDVARVVYGKDTMNSNDNYKRVAVGLRNFIVNSLVELYEEALTAQCENTVARERAYSY